MGRRGQCSGSRLPQEDRSGEGNFLGLELAPLILAHQEERVSWGCSECSQACLLMPGEDEEMADLMEDVSVRSVSSSYCQRASDLSLGPTTSHLSPGDIVPALLLKYSVGPQRLDALKHPM